MLPATTVWLEGLIATEKLVAVNEAVVGDDRVRIVSVSGCDGHRTSPAVVGVTENGHGRDRTSLQDGYNASRIRAGRRDYKCYRLHRRRW